MTIRKSVTVAAPPDVVWRALVDAEELRRWFPVDAKVEPGPGGSVWMSWGPGSEGSARIEIWEPDRRLALVESYGGNPPVGVTVEYQLEGTGGSTVLRLVQSGFGGGDWEAQYDSLDGGWTYFLFNLKHYLERHRGVPRKLVWERRRLAAPRERVWDALTGPGGLVRSGDRILLPLDGEEIAGQVFLDRRPTHLATLLPALDDALLFVELESGAGAWHCGSYLSTYGLPEGRLASLRRGFPSLLDRILRPFEAAPV